MSAASVKIDHAAILSREYDLLVKRVLESLRQPDKIAEIESKSPQRRFYLDPLRQVGFVNYHGRRLDLWLGPGVPLTAVDRKAPGGIRREDHEPPVGFYIAGNPSDTSAWPDNYLDTVRTAVMAMPRCAQLRTRSNPGSPELRRLMEQLRDGELLGEKFRMESPLGTALMYTRWTQLTANQAGHLTRDTVDMEKCCPDSPTISYLHYELLGKIGNETFSVLYSAIVCAVIVKEDGRWRSWKQHDHFHSPLTYTPLSPRPPHEWTNDPLPDYFPRPDEVLPSLSHRQRRIYHNVYESLV